MDVQEAKEGMKAEEIFFNALNPLLWCIYIEIVGMKIQEH